MKIGYNDDCPICRKIRNKPSRNRYYDKKNPKPNPYKKKKNPDNQRLIPH